MLRTKCKNIHQNDFLILKYLHTWRERMCLCAYVCRFSLYLTGMETSWRPVGDSSLRGSRRRLLEIWRVARESRWNQTCSIFSATLWRLFQVSSWSRRRRGDVAATKYVFEEEDVSPRPARDQMIEEKLRRRLRDVSATSRRRLRDDDWPSFIDLERNYQKS